MSEQMEAELEVEDEAEGTEEVEAKVDLKDVLDELHNRSDAYDKLTASWVRGQLRKANPALMEAFSQDSNRRWVVDLDLSDAADAVANAWDNRRKRGTPAEDTSEDSDMDVDEGEEDEDEA